MAIKLQPLLPRGGITEAELEQIRDNQLSFLPESVIIRRRIYDEHDFVTSTVASEVPARFHAGAGRFLDVADRLQALNPYVITLPYDQEVQASDQIIDSEGRVFEVRMVRDPKSYHTAKQLLAEAVT